MWLQICVKPTSPATRFNPMDNYNEKWRRCGQARTTPSRSGFDTTYIREYRMEGSVREEFSIRRRRRQGGGVLTVTATGQEGAAEGRGGGGGGGGRGRGARREEASEGSPQRRARHLAARWCAAPPPETPARGGGGGGGDWGAGDLGVWDLLRLGPWRISLFCAVLSCWFFFFEVLSCWFCLYLFALLPLRSHYEVHRLV